MRDTSIRKLVYSALFSTLIFIGTQFIKIPLIVGYLNIGDCFVLLLGWIVGGVWGMIGASIGAGLADLLSGYAVYVPVTVIVKAIMALIAFLGYKIVEKKSKKFLIVGYIVSGVVAELIMVFGYYLFESVLYGFATAGVAMVGNLIQGAISLTLSIILISILGSVGVVKQIRQ